MSAGGGEKDRSWLRSIGPKIRDAAVAKAALTVAGSIFTLIFVGYFGLTSERVRSSIDSSVSAIVAWLSTRVEFTRLWALTLIAMCCVVAGLAFVYIWSWRRINVVQVATGAASVSTPARPKFQRITAVDKRYDLEWHILQPLSKWIDDPATLTSSRAYQITVLAGPYHIGDDCRAELATGVHGGMSVFERECPACQKLIFGYKSPINAWEATTQALRELQRLHRNGTPMTNGVELKQPLYWKFMLPPSA
jgi:hypothetical protein